AAARNRRGDQAKRSEEASRKRMQHGVTLEPSQVPFSDRAPTRAGGPQAQGTLAGVGTVVPPRTASTTSALSFLSAFSHLSVTSAIVAPLHSFLRSDATLDSASFCRSAFCVASSRIRHGTSAFFGLGGVAKRTSSADSVAHVPSQRSTSKL